MLKVRLIFRDHTSMQLDISDRATLNDVDWLWSEVRAVEIISYTPGAI